ncbi:MAG: DUF4126 domain-containing protein [Burkholderiales bacterium]|uniref:DUF4126 domain-containing protein n=1 Tax=Ottowia pentelensis TaxID=511108 RepID=A0ABV6PRE4_9BURK|nr:DUF4126 domain-containing protein [Ottowia sp.]MBN9404241.1 DUF4126 domain-containing protein [Burkholderiales bacterium]MBS0402455.1 DUF4126 domain-containing protein [Pseudomonadota bacterium]MBS0413693.1 DUF4126 domain-containing protein [Pseudomonadota bacterium]
MQELVQTFVQWLHGIGFGPDAGTAAAVGSAAGQVGDAVSQATARMDMPSLVALAAALGWASGFRLYAVVFLTGALGAAGWIALPPGLHVLAHPAVLTASGFMMLVEFFADKIPWVDSLWDTVHSVIRIPAGALLAAGVFGADSGTMGLVAGLLGGSLAATAFATKATTRAAINTSPEPFSNWGASLFEDGLSVAVVWLATQHPLLFGVALAVMLVLSALLLVLLFKFFKLVLRKLGAFLGRSPPAPQGVP